MKIQAIIRSPKSSGRRHLLAFMQGKPLSRSQAVIAKCFECCNGYIDGRQDCSMPDCPLYQFMAYRKTTS